MTQRPDFERVFQLLPDPYMVLDHELRYVAASDVYLQTTGTQRESLIGRHIFELFPNDPNDPNNPSALMLRASLERVRSTGKPDTLALIPYRVFREAGSQTLTEERFWSATHTPLLDAQGQVEFIIQHTVDVTDLERARNEARAGRPPTVAVEAGVLSRAEKVQALNQQLDLERRRLLELFDQAPGFLCFLRGERHVFELANRAYLLLVGGRQVVGKSVKEALPEVESQGFIELLDDVYRTGRPFVGSGVKIQLAAGVDTPAREALLDFIYQPVREADGRVSGILVQGTDVTARHQAEREKESALRAAETFAEEMATQSREVQQALEQATQRIRELEAKAALPTP